MCRCYRNILPKAFTEATVSLDTFREMHQGKVLKRFSWFVKFNKSQLWIPSFRNISMLLLCLGYLSFFSSLIYSLLLKFDVITFSELLPEKLCGYKIKNVNGQYSIFLQALCKHKNWNYLKFFIDICKSSDTFLNNSKLLRIIRLVTLKMIKHTLKILRCSQCKMLKVCLVIFQYYA